MEVFIHEASINNNQQETSNVVSNGNVEKLVKSAIVGTVTEPLLNGDVESFNFTQLRPKQAIDLDFRDIVYTAEHGLFKKGTVKGVLIPLSIVNHVERKEILHHINGRFPPGQLVAIMGPSGAGKSSLLDILSGYRIGGVKGTVYTNGMARDLKAFRKLSCYIQQDDRLQPLLTTYENMEIAADLKLSSDVPRKEKIEIIDEILKMLGLDKAKTTKAAGLSGGQKKRLSIALELINNPQIMFLDEPTTGLDSSSCTQCVKLLKELAKGGRTIICTIHQPSASLFQLFDQVYVLSSGNCLYQGSTDNLVPYLNELDFPCPVYHNPADYVIELACGEHGEDKVTAMIEKSANGQSLAFFDRPDLLPNPSTLREKNSAGEECEDDDLQATSSCNQLKVLLRRGYIKTKRDQTLTYTRFGVNVAVGLMLGTLYWQAGSDGTKVIDNYNLLFSILMHHMMSTMMLTILTFPNEMSILIKEHFNRWYSLKMYYASVTLIDIPVSVGCCLVFTAIIYVATGQPPQWERFFMFFVISQLVVFVAQSFGLMIGAIVGVVNGTFLGPTLSVPMMMFAGFGVTLRDLPTYLYWGSYISYLRYGLEGIVGAIYGMDRPTIYCPDDAYCHYKYPKKFLEDIAMKGDQFANDLIALLIILFALRVLSYYLLRFKLRAVR